MQIATQELNVQKDFPILQRTIHGKRLIYLDNSATSQKPRVVIGAISRYYETTNANVHRGIHTLSEESTAAYDSTRKSTASFISSNPTEIIFTKNTTESLNIAANILTKDLQSGDEIILTVMDHHSNIVPWQIAAKEKGLVIKYCTLTNDYQLDLAHFQRILNDNTKIVSFPHMSNVLGTINPVREITRLAHQHNAIVVVDGAQAIPHMPVNVKELEVDMYAFSSHKMCGPTGVGVLYCKEALLVTLPPFMTGGGTILDVTLQGTTFAAGPERYEAGTPNIADVIAFGTAIEYLQTIGMNKIAQHEMELTQYALIKLSAIPSIIVHGSKTNRGGVVSFSHPTIHPHDMAQVLDTEGVAVRAGHHCAKPLMQWLGITGCTRASFYLYNTKADIDTLVFGIQKAIEVFQC